MKQDLIDNHSAKLIDPDPFLLAGVCLQAAAVILQLVQIAQQLREKPAPTSTFSQRARVFEEIESALEDFDKAITKSERSIRRESAAPTRQFYESSFRVSLGIMEFNSHGVKEYHDNIANSAAQLASLTRWIGHIISQDAAASAELGNEILEIVGQSSDRLNKLMSDGGHIELVLNESKLGSGLTDQSQKMTVAASAIAEKKAVGQRS